jgi:hypothetical protein
MSTGAGIALLAVGGILRFAVAPGSPLGVNVHVVGVVLMLAGAVVLLLALRGRGLLNRSGNPPDGSRPPTLTRQRDGYQSRPPAAADQLVHQDKQPR